MFIFSLVNKVTKMVITLKKKKLYNLHYPALFDFLIHFLHFLAYDDR